MYIRIGGRGSRLSRIQMEIVANLLYNAEPNLNIEYIFIRTRGDVDRSSPLYRLRGRGIFEREVNRALKEGRIDVAVHSAKDVPFESIEEHGFQAIVPRRDSRYDVLISRSGLGLESLPPGSIVGTSSLRRLSFLRYYRGDIEVRNIRGNVDTRIRKVMDGGYDAVVLAEAGLERLGIDINFHRLSLDEFIPAAGQGALLLMVRPGSEAEELVRSIGDRASYLEVMFEKIFLRFVGGGCNIPIGVTSFYDGGAGGLRVVAGVVSPDFRRRVVVKRFIDVDEASSIDLDYIRGLAREFFDYFGESGGMDLVEGWLDGRSV